MCIFHSRNILAAFLMFFILASNAFALEFGVSTRAGSEFWYDDSIMSELSNTSDAGNSYAVYIGATPGINIFAAFPLSRAVAGEISIAYACHAQAHGVHDSTDTLLSLTTEVFQGMELIPSFIFRIPLSPASSLRVGFGAGIGYIIVPLSTRTRYSGNISRDTAFIYGPNERFYLPLTFKTEWESGKKGLVLSAGIEISGVFATLDTTNMNNVTNITNVSLSAGIKYIIPAEGAAK